MSRMKKKPRKHGVDIERESCKKYKNTNIYFFSDDFGVRSPVIQNHFRQKKVYLNTSTVASVYLRCA